MASWSDLPGELLRIIIAALPNPIHHVRFQAVCRSWRSVPSPRKLPRVLLPTGSLLLPFDSAPHRMFPLPENQRFVGSTDCFLTIDVIDAHNKHTYVLTNPFSRTMLELPELDAVIGNVPETFGIHKVLTHSGLHGLVVIRTDNRNHPIILLNPGKGVWLPKPRHQPFTRIIDVAFLGDTLYAITQAENLISLGVAFDTKGIPTVTSIKRVITGPIVTLEKEKDAPGNRSPCDYIINDAMHLARDHERPHVDILTAWYLVQSHGKLLMVRREMECTSYLEGFTRKVEVFEADIGARTWVPVSTGLHGHALFLSKHSSKSIVAGDEIEEDAIYFIDNGEVFNLRSKTTSPPNKDFGFDAMWLFYPSSL
uniref:KIB1-4 beta-propeller domain-containing protein n=1 Tax=Aegilops tauschii TaxID=37682 RepID=M8BE20_AEGTA